MRIAAIADIHSNLDFKVPKADLLLIAGDLCPATHYASSSVSMQSNWLNFQFRLWLSDQPIKECVVISGNHDWIWETTPNIVPIMGERFHYIEDESIDILDLKIYGTPVQPPFNGWAFNREEESLQKYWDNIPEGLDILLLHCPPYGILDETHHPNYPSEHIGSKSLKKRIKEVKPKIVVFGHNHGEHGIVEEDGIKYINASLVNEEYKMTKKPIVIEL